MTTLNLNELELLANLDVVSEEIIRPENARPISNETMFNEEFAEVVPEIMTYTESKDSELREMFKTAKQWAFEKESPELITEVLTSYSPVKISKSDMNVLINSAVK